MNKKIYLIGNAHIDPVWHWRWQDGFSEIKATFKSVLDRMNEFPNFKFTCAGSMYYEWIEKSDPKMFAEIKRRIEEGRWCVVGGWFLQPDCNLPCGESFARHGLIAQGYFAEKFGKIAKIGYNVDSFGHNSGLPQILKKSGMDAYVFMRPMDHEKDIPRRLFIWKGHDGSEITAYRIPLGYGLTKVEEIVQLEEISNTENTDLMAFFGIGNHGGGPTIQLLEEINEKLGGNDRYVYGTVNEYFDCVNKEELPIVCGELQYHAKGCYSAETSIKKHNREMENNILTAEIFSVFSEKLIGTEYPAKALKKAWKNTLFNQFHDILGGCIVKRAVEDSTYLHGETMSITEQAINFALQQISWNIDTLKGYTEEIFRDDRFFPFTHEELGSPIVIFNPLPFEATLPATVYPKCMRVEEENGDAVPFQIVRGQQTDGPDLRYNTLIYTKVPAFGYKVVRAFRTGESPKTESPFSYGEDFIENACLRVTFDRESGSIISFFDKRNGKEILSGACSNIWCDDTDHDTWAHTIEKFDKKIAEYGNAELRIVECGDVRIVMRVTSYCEGFSLQQDYALYKDESVLRVQAKTSGCKDRRILRLAFPVNVEAGKSFTEIPYGVTERSTDNNEHPCGKWFAVTDEDCKFGLTVMNDSKHSYSVDNNTAYLTVLRTTSYCEHYVYGFGSERDEYCECMDTGVHTFSYALAPFESMANSEKQAYTVNFGARAVLETFHKGTLDTEFTGMKVQDESIIVTAMKKAEDGHGYIFRAYEANGKIVETDLDIPALGVKTKVVFAPFEVKTFRFNNGIITETNLIEGVGDSK